MSKRPLNGTKTHPLSAFAIRELRDIGQSPVPRQTLNPGVINRLEREDLVEHVSLPSPYKVHKGRDIAFVKISPAGRNRLIQLEKERA